VREIHRVLRSGGVFGARETDLVASRYVAANLDALTAQAYDLVLQWQAHRGTDIQFGRQLRGVLNRAGFQRVEASASYDSNGTPEAVRQWADTMVRILQQDSLVDLAVTSGWADHETLARVCAAWQAWGARPASFDASSMGEAVGWKEK
jgi:hypothetical protein